MCYIPYRCTVTLSNVTNLEPFAWFLTYKCGPAQAQKIDPFVILSIRQYDEGMDCSPGTDVIRLCEVLLYHCMNGDRGVR